MPGKGWPEGGQPPAPAGLHAAARAVLTCGVYLIGYRSWTAWAITLLGSAHLAVQIDSVAL